jgi:hypothetical protein
MSVNSRIYTITDSSDSTPIISANADSQEIILRNSGDNTVYFGFNASVSTDSNGPYGTYINSGEYVGFTRLKASTDIYARCSSGLTSTLMGEIR